MRDLYLLLLAILALSQPWTCKGTFFDEPKVQWTYRLPGAGSLAGRGLRSGNEVLASPDGSMLFATADDGSLHFVNIEKLRDSVVFEPAPIPGTYTECRSGVTLVHDPATNDVNYIVYAVIDVPVKAGVLYDGIEFDPSRSSTLSRLLAVNLDGSLRYSMPLSGAVVGKPVTSQDGDKVFVVHNVPNFIGSSPTRGKVSVITLGGGNNLSVTASLSPLNQHGPFGPPAGAAFSNAGRQHDVLVVAEAWDEGFSSTNGMVYVLKPSSLYETFDGQGNDAYELTLVTDLSISTYARPSLSSDATEVFVGTSGARLSGWTGGNDISDILSGEADNVNQKWVLALETNKGNSSQPLLVAPILSSDDSLVYQVGASTQMYCIDAQKGNILWNSDGALRGTITAEPRLVERLAEEPKVFVIEGMKGKVRQHNALTGAIDWSFDCQAVSGVPCNDAVEAEFSVSPTGTSLYYGDIFGKIVALEVADYKASTNAPTTTPTAKPVEIEPEEEVELPVDPPKETATPTGSPVVPATPAPVTVVEPNIDNVPFDAEDDDKALEYPTTLVDAGNDMQENNSEFSAAAAAADNGEDDDESFFSNDIMIILVAVCGGLALAIIVLLIAQKARNLKSNNSKPADHTLVAREDDGKDYNNDQEEYEEACRRDEEETIQEIVDLASKTPPNKGKRNSKKQKKSSPMTPSTLASIEECPGEAELSFVSDATPKNLEKSFEASLVEAASKGACQGVSQEVTLTEARDQMSARDSSEQEKDASISDEADVPPTLSGVEVVKSEVFKPKPQSRFAISPVPSTDCANDIMSVDGSLYLDDDSYLQGSKFDVASLSQYSVASTLEGNNSEVGSHYPGEEGSIRYEAAHSSGPGDQYMQPPRVASPLLRSNLSPQVENYLRRSESSMSPNPMTPKNAYVPSPTSPLSTSPVTPPSGGSGAGGAFDRESVRKGQSVRPGGQGRSREPAENKSRGRTPSPPRPPVGTEDVDEPEDAWNSFLSELAKAEREFFNPNLGQKKQNEPGNGRPSSPPPPPPPGPPPNSSTQGPPPPPPPPRDPPVGGRHRKLLL